MSTKKPAIGEQVMIPTGPATAEPYVCLERHEGSHIVLTKGPDFRTLIGMPWPSWEAPDTWCYAYTLEAARQATMTLRPRMVTGKTTHQCPEMNRAIEESDEDRPFWEIDFSVAGEVWKARNHKGGIPIQFCPFCGGRLSEMVATELKVTPAAPTCQRCMERCHCGVIQIHDCVHPTKVEDGAPPAPTCRACSLGTPKYCRDCYVDAGRDPDGR